MYILGIESSCDETAAAIVEDGKHLISNVISTSVKEQALYGGVVPEIASRRHAEYISATVQQALHDANMAIADVDAVAVIGVPVDSVPSMVMVLPKPSLVAMSETLLAPSFTPSWANAVLDDHATASCREICPLTPSARRRTCSASAGIPSGPCVCRRGLRTSIGPRWKAISSGRRRQDPATGPSLHRKSLSGSCCQRHVR